MEVKTEETINELINVLEAFKSQNTRVEETGQVVIKSLQSSNKILACGNGGSAADALHLSEELVGRYRGERRPLPAIGLPGDSTAITCICNDYGYEEVFSRQIQALGKPGDVLVAFSTSGNSPNILRALAIAKKMDIHAILLTGKDGGTGKSLADHSIIVPSQNTARIQEIHTLILHHWLEMVEALEW